MLLPALLLLSGPAWGLTGFGNLFDPGSRLYEIKTRHFRFVYPEKSRESAKVLASYADGLYEQLLKVFPTGYPKGITVILSPDVETENGFFNPVPTPHIVLTDYQANVSWLNTEEYFKQLFYHELVHAMSLSGRGAIFRVLSDVFGDYLNSNLLLPTSMLEGVTVSFESIDGRGRANHPLVREGLIQDALEKKFKRPDQAAGSYDLYPWGNLAYYYGGLFSAYLQQKYGMERYSRLWEKTGNAEIFESAFAEVYSNSLENEWASFRDGFEISNVCRPPSSLWTSRLYYIGFGRLFENKGEIYFGDSYQRVIYRLEPGKENPMIERPGNGLMAVSDRQWLIADSFYDHQVLKSRAYVVDRKSGRIRADLGEGIAVADFCGEGVVFVRANGHRNELVYRLPDGTERQLLPSGEKVSYYQVAAYGPDQAAVLFSDSGRRHIALISLSGSAVKKLSNLPEFIESFSVHGDSIVFSYNDQSLSRPGIWSNGQLMLSEVLVSGGVHFPLLCGDRLIYAGRFSDGDRIFSTSPEDWNFRDGVSAPLEDFSLPREVSSTAPEYSEKSYNDLSWLFPRLWSPMIHFDWGTWFPNSYGIQIAGMDLIYQNRYTLCLEYYPEKPFARLDWVHQNTALGFDLKFEAKDVLYSSLEGLYRQSLGTIYAGQNWGIPASTAVLYLSTTGTVYANAKDNSDLNPYLWTYGRTLSRYTATLTFSTEVRKLVWGQTRGWLIQSGTFYEPSSGLYGFNAAVRYNFNFIPLKAVLYSAWTARPSLEFTDYLDQYGELPVYSDPGNVRLSGDRDYLISLQAVIPLWHAEIQWGPQVVPFYLNRFYQKIGTQALYCGETGASVFTELGLESSVVYGNSTPSASAIAYYNLLTRGWGVSLSWNLGFDLF